MTSVRAPRVFVSSTCYDLNQLRQDLKVFIENAGYVAILSEFESFPVNPVLDTIDNCLKTVRDDADIFVLIVGNRYGSVSDAGKSITNLEYLEARAKGIPVFAFVLKEIITSLRIWRDNPTATFSAVDSSALFQFVDSLLKPGALWVYSFEDAQTIISILRKQWAALFIDALRIWSKAQNGRLAGIRSELSGKCLRSFLEQPLGWEYAIFSDTLARALGEAAQLKNDMISGITFGPLEHIDETAFFGWSSERFSEAQHLVSILNKLLNEAAAEALGPPGAPADIDRTIHVAGQIAECYRGAIEWSLRFKRIRTSPIFDPLLEIVSGSIRNYIEKIEEFSARLDAEVESIERNPVALGETREVRIMIVIDLPETFEADYERELERLKRHFGLS